MKQLARGLASNGSATKPAQSLRARDSVRFASYNIHLGIGRDGEFSPERIADVIGELDADVVALQEVSFGAPGFDMLHYLSTACGMTAVPGPTLETSSGEYGNAILTRLGLGEVQRWDLSVASREPRGAIDARVRHNGHTLRVIATHLGLRPAERRRQIRQLLKIIESDKGHPTVLLGDVNEWFLWGRPLRWMHRHFERTPAPATFPAGRPIFSLDRIWVEPRGALKSIAAHASKAARIASDHLPIVASIDFGPNEQAHGAGAQSRARAADRDETTKSFS